ncbi:MAG: hypothetical protein ABII26_00695 [Pseudomonadota bacterium]
MFLINILLLSLMLNLSCGEERERLEGKYLATNNKNQRATAIYLELGSNGRGSWSTEEDTVSLKWEIKKNEIWLHTHSGGVIVCKISGDIIEARLPSAGVHSFKRVRK